MYSTVIPCFHILAKVDLCLTTWLVLQKKTVRGNFWAPAKILKIWFYVRPLVRRTIKFPPQLRGN